MPGSDQQALSVPLPAPQPALSRRERRNRLLSCRDLLNLE
jgi:hypothetical protein